MRAEPLEDLLPWRHPFLLIDRVLDCVPHKTITTLKTICGDDLLAFAHGSGAAACPDLLVLEGMNQTAALLYRLTYGAIPADRVPLLGQLRARFPGSAVPGDTITYTVRAVKMTPTHGLFEGEAAVAGRRIVEGELAFAVAPGPAAPTVGGENSAGRGGGPTP